MGALSIQQGECSGVSVGSRTWLLIRITWGKKKNSNAHLSSLDHCNQNLGNLVGWSGLRHQYLLKLPWEILVCSQSWEPRSQLGLSPNSPSIGFLCTPAFLLPWLSESGLDPVWSTCLQGPLVSRDQKDVTVLQSTSPGPATWTQSWKLKSPGAP